MGSTKYLALTFFVTIILASAVQAYSTDITVKTDVPYYDVAVRLINYVNEDVIGSVYLKTDATGFASGNFTTDQELVKISILIYRNGIIFKQFDNYGTYRTTNMINLDLRENNQTTGTNITNSTMPDTNSTSNNQTNSTNMTTTISSTTTGNVIAPATISKQFGNIWIYVVAGLVVVGAVGFAGFKYIQQNKMSGLSHYEKAKGPIEEKPLFPSSFQPVSEKMDSIAAQRELQSAKDRIRNLERELSQAKNADKIREMERKIEEDKKRLDRLRRGENV